MTAHSGGMKLTISTSGQHRGGGHYEQDDLVQAEVAFGHVRIRQGEEALVRAIL